VLLYQFIRGLKMIKRIAISILAICFLIGLSPACQVTPITQETTNVEKQQVQEPLFKVTSINVKPDLVVDGDNVTINAVIISENHIPGEYSAILKLDNVIVDEKKLALQIIYHLK